MRRFNGRSPAVKFGVDQRFRKKRGNGPSFLAEIAFGRVPLSAPIPAVGIGKIALHAMQPRMDPCAFGARIVLGNLVSGLPFPVQSVPHGPEQWGGNRRRVPGLVSRKAATSAFMKCPLEVGLSWFQVSEIIQPDS
jgi:hypothetical protein